MGLIKAGMGALGSTMRDQWKEFFYSDALDDRTLMVRGQKKTSGSNRGSDNIISNGSKIAIANGQAMLIVDQGQVVDFSAEPGEYIYDSSSEASIFEGSLSEGIRGSLETIKRRFTMSGDSGRVQRIYYINTKEIQGNKFGTPNPIPFRIVDRNIGLDIDLSLRINGEYSFRIIDPILFYTNVAGNVTTSYMKDQLEDTMRMEFLTALQPALAELSSRGIRYSELPGYSQELSRLMNQVLSDQWRELRGIEIVSLGLNSVTVPEEDQALIKEIQKSAVYKNPSMAGAAMVGAQVDAMRNASQNPAGSMGGFVGLNLAEKAGGNRAQDFYQMAAEEGRKQDGWTCPQCGHENQGKFCSNCGHPRPQTSCPHCGHAFSDQARPGKFCPECGKKL